MNFALLNALQEHLYYEIPGGRVVANVVGAVVVVVVGAVVVVVGAVVVVVVGAVVVVVGAIVVVVVIFGGTGWHGRG